ncbi:MAG: hypothetical protein QOJ85_328, partial [Solirubrobacteraceae bacterium]|nr:hypothetical protein [Solirubrobacteraceae bacterium]
SNNEIPQDLNPNMKVMGLTEAEAKTTRHFRFERQSGHWTINGTTWDDVVNSDYQMVLATPGYNDVEIWELQNPAGGWFHPVHIHLIDFSKYQIGERVVLENDSPKNNIDFDTISQIMAFDVVSEATDLTNNEVPQDLNPNMKVMGLTEADAMRTRKFEFKREGGNWTINGTTWDDVVNSDYKMVLANPGFEDTEIWELSNPHGGWFHPVHIHLVDFKLLDRNGRAPFDYEKGPKDVVYIGENETVRVIMKFENQQGRYMMHCHNLVHEDHDMMGQFLVGEDSPECDPIFADKATREPARPVRDRHDDPDEDNGGGGNGSGSGSGSGSGDSGSGSGGGDGGGGSGGGGDNSGPGNADDPVSASSVVASATASASSVSKTCLPAKKKPVLKKTAKQQRAINKKKATVKKKPAVKARTTAKSTSTAAHCATPANGKPAAAKATRKRKRTTIAKRKRSGRHR